MTLKKIICIFLACLPILAFCSCDSSKLSSVPNHRLQWWLEEIGWDDDSRTNISGKNVKIAVIDSGVDLDHNDIAYSIKKTIKVSQLDESSVGDNSHGTGVTAVICGRCKNESGILGVAPDSKIISIDVTDAADNTVEEENLIEGIALAVDEKVDIINISMGIK